MSAKTIIDLAIGVSILLICASDTWKGILMLTRDEHPLLFVAGIAFRLIRLLPASIGQNQYDKAMEIYIRRRKLYGTFALMGGLWGILLGLVIILNA